MKEKINAYKVLWVNVYDRKNLIDHVMNGGIILTKTDIKDS
jgi:hypothetical protein